MRREQILSEILKNLKEINQRLKEIDEKRQELIEKLIDSEIKVIDTYDKLTKLEPMIEVLWEKEMEKYGNKLNLVEENVN